jgi:hypothetical protein
MYFTTTIPDIMFATIFVSIFIESPKVYDWKVGKRILRYVARTLKFGL